ncbi:MAG: nitrogen regulation protein NR(I), partial [Alphaproteobacteria bacterium]
AIYRLVARVMNTDLAILILGESGTGKSLIARAVHDLSDRRNLPFVAAGGAELGDAGQARRIIARAGAGTLVIEEAGDLDAAAQARLVGLLDALPAEGAPRIMATSQADLARRTGEGGFRRDLFYRLAGVQLTMPPLRERIDDIPLLAEHFLARAVQAGLAPRRLSEEAMAQLRAYAWPGNVRQLENALRRLAVTGQEPEISAAELPAVISGEPSPSPAGEGGGERLSTSIARHLKRYFDLHGGELPPPGLYQRILREMELPLIEIALDATGGNQARCAALLGINRNTLRKKITELDIEVTRRRKLM